MAVHRVFCPPRTFVLEFVPGDMLPDLDAPSQSSLPFASASKAYDVAPAGPWTDHLQCLTPSDDHKSRVC